MSSKAMRSLPEASVGRLLLHLLGSPDESPREALAHLAPDELRVLETARNLVSTDISELQESLESRERLRNVLEATLLSHVQNTDRGRRAWQSIVERDEIPLSLMRISWTQFRVQPLGEGVTREDVENVIRSPETSEYLFKYRADPKAPRIALAAAHFTINGATPIVLIVVGQVKDLELQINRVWRLPATLLREHKIDALAAFQRFCAEYGHDHTVGSRPWRRLILDETFRLYGRDAIVQARHPLPKSWDSMVLFRISELGVIEVAIAYGVDLVKYRQDPRIFPQ